MDHRLIWLTSLLSSDFLTAKLKEFEKIFPITNSMTLKHVDIVIPILSLMGYYENGLMLHGYVGLVKAKSWCYSPHTSNVRSAQEMERRQEDQFFRHEFCLHSPSKSSVYLTIEKWRSPMENASHSISQFHTNPSKMTFPSTPPKPNMEPEKWLPLKRNLIFQIFNLELHLSFWRYTISSLFSFFVQRFG